MYLSLKRFQISYDFSAKTNGLNSKLRYGVYSDFRNL